MLSRPAVIWERLKKEREQNRSAPFAVRAVGSRLRLQLRRGFLQTVDQLAAVRRSLEFGFFDDGARGGVLAVDLAIGVVVRTERGAFERDAGEDAARAGVAEHFSAHGYVGIGFRVAALGSGSDGS